MLRTYVPWTAEEDAQLTQMIEKMRANGKMRADDRIVIGAKEVIALAAAIRRPVSSVTARWNEHLRPGTNKSGFTEAEDAEILKLEKVHGKKWKIISEHMSTKRTGLQVRRRYIALSLRFAQKPEETENPETDAKCDEKPVGVVAVAAPPPPPTEVVTAVQSEVKPAKVVHSDGLTLGEFARDVGLDIQPKKKDEVTRVAIDENGVKANSVLYKLDTAPKFQPGKNGKLVLGLVDVSHLCGLPDDEGDREVKRLGLCGFGAFAF